MNQLDHELLSGWANFYVIVGSASAALISVQFVVMTLIAAVRIRSTTDSINAFGTPTVVHFSGALLVSGILSAPWQSLGAMSIPLAVCGVAGLAYGGIVARRAYRQTGYDTVWQDWLWHTALPFCVYGTLAVSALFLRAAPRRALFAVGTAALGLLFVAIHNAWDSMTHILTTSQTDQTSAE